MAVYLSLEGVREIRYGQTNVVFCVMEMEACSRILACEIPWTGEPGGLQSMVSPKSRTRLSD